MEEKNQKAPGKGGNSANLGRQFKGTEIQRFNQYLKTNIATCSMVAKAIDVHQKNLTRYKRELEKIGLLYQYPTKAICKDSGFKAHYLTTNPDLINKEVRK